MCTQLCCVVFCFIDIIILCRFMWIDPYLSVLFNYSVLTICWLLNYDKCFSAEYELLMKYPVWNWCLTLIARFMGPTWGPHGADRSQVGPMLALELCYLENSLGSIDPARKAITHLKTSLTPHNKDQSITTLLRLKIGTTHNLSQGTDETWLMAWCWRQSKRYIKKNKEKIFLLDPSQSILIMWILVSIIKKTILINYKLETKLTVFNKYCYKI